MDTKEINNLYDYHFTYDLSIPFECQELQQYKKNIEVLIPQLDDQSAIEELIKNYEKKILYINPVRMKDYSRFYTDVNCLMIEKNKIPDPKIISMSYLDFLFHLIQNDSSGVIYSSMLSDLLNLCLGVDQENQKFFRDEKGKVNLILGLKQDDGSIVDVVLNKNDFNNIKDIVLCQNISEYDDTYIDPKLEEALQEAEKHINKHKKKIGSLEEQIICVLISTNLNLEQISNLTLRKFTKILQRVDFKLHYGIYKTAECSGFVTFKDGSIDHWMSDLSTKDKYAGTMIDFDTLKNKIQGKTN